MIPSISIGSRLLETGTNFLSDTESKNANLYPNLGIYIACFLLVQVNYQVKRGCICEGWLWTSLIVIVIFVPSPINISVFHSRPCGVPMIALSAGYLKLMTFSLPKLHVMMSTHSFVVVHGATTLYSNNRINHGPCEKWNSQLDDYSNH